MKLYGDVKDWPEPGVRVSWSSGSVSVPRCSACRNAHEHIESRVRTFKFVSLAVAGVSALTAAAVLSVVWVLPIMVVLFVAQDVVHEAGRRAARRVNARAVAFPPVAELLEQPGWSLGDRPPDAPR